MTIEDFLHPVENCGNLILHSIMKLLIRKKIIKLVLLYFRINFDNPTRACCFIWSDKSIDYSFNNSEMSIKRFPQI